MVVNAPRYVEFLTHKTGLARIPHSANGFAVGFVG